VHLDSRVLDCVLLAAGRNYSADVTRRSPARQISPLYDDSGVAIGLDDSLCFECPL
jgi:hypothetical protein